MTAEHWRAIPLAPGYEASNKGRVRSFRRGAPKRGRILSLSPKKPGSPYRVVRIHHGGSWRVRLVHQLVLEAFVGPWPATAHGVRHLNGNGSDNRVANLAWGTAAENMQDRIRLGEHHYSRRTHCVHDHEFTPENTRYNPSKPSSRVCRTCERARNAAHKARVRLASKPIVPPEWADAIETRELRAS